ncbi:glycosyltransferase [Candidatus Zixiibacteriota bacterium]
MICLMHGYLLEGSGSNLWTRAMAENMCSIGETIHLFCQENHPERYDFISEAYTYEPGGQRKILLKREPLHKGTCVLHKPTLGDTLPVYVCDRYEEFPNVVSMTELSIEELETYLARNLEVLLEIIGEYDIENLLVNHAVLMSVVAKRAHQASGIPYSIVPHGSAMVYAVEKDERFRHLAHEAFAEAKHILTIGPEMRKRVVDLFPNIPELENKLIPLKLGVDAKMFQPIPRQQRAVQIKNLIEMISRLPEEQKRQQDNDVFDKICAAASRDEFVRILKEPGKYDRQVPVADIGEKLQKVHWNRDRVIISIGRLISNKGFQTIIPALPCILARHPRVRLIIVGHGPLQPLIEVLVRAMAEGNRDLFKRILDWGGDLEEIGADPLAATTAFLDHLIQEGTWETYWDDAQKYMSDARVIFTGYLEHHQLRYLLPCADLAIFPSLVAEAGPLVFLEALSCGVFPLGSYFSGIAQSIDSTEGYLPSEIVEIMKLRPSDNYLVNDIINKSIKAIETGPKFKSALRRVAVENYTWESSARDLLSRL